MISANARVAGVVRLTLAYAMSRKDRTDPQSFEQVVPLEALKTCLGVVRWYFRCPSCARRCGKLYQPCSRRRGTGFRCRICHSLTYRKRVASRQRPIPPHIWRQLRELFGEPENPNVLPLLRSVGDSPAKPLMAAPAARRRWSKPSLEIRSPGHWLTASAGAGRLHRRRTRLECRALPENLPEHDREAAGPTFDASKCRDALDEPEHRH